MLVLYGRPVMRLLTFVECLNSILVEKCSFLYSLQYFICFIFMRQLKFYFIDPIFGSLYSIRKHKAKTIVCKYIFCYSKSRTIFHIAAERS